MVRPIPLNRRGVALPIAVLSLVVIAALVAGAFVVSRTERAGATNAVFATQAAEAADAGLTFAVNEWDPSTDNALPIYTTANPQELVRTVSLGSSARATATIRRLNQSLFLVRSSGDRLGAGNTVLANRMTSALVRLARPTVNVNAAITVQEPVRPNGSSFDISGVNANPNGWNDCPAVSASNADDRVGIRSSQDATQGASANELARIQGYPSGWVANDPTINSSTFQNFLDYTYATLSSQPNVKRINTSVPGLNVNNQGNVQDVGPVLNTTVTPATCDRNAPANFGEPRRPPDTYVAQCTNYFPVVHSTMSTTKFASGTRGQGTLLLDGDLEIAGNFEWAGLIIARGSVTFSGTGGSTGAKITGAVLAEGITTSTTNTVQGNVSIQYSDCAIQRAVSGASYAALLGQRSWGYLN